MKIIHKHIKDNPQELLDALIEQHGLEAVKRGLMPMKTGGACDNGYHWDNVLHRCVLNAGIKNPL